MLVCTLLLTCGTGIAFGLVPAIQAPKADLNAVIKHGTPGAVGNRGGRLRGTLAGRRATRADPMATLRYD